MRLPGVFTSWGAAFLIGCLLPCAVAAYFDARRWLLPDRITLPLLLAGAVAAVLADRVGTAALGCLVAGGAVLVCCLLGGAGGGDFKLASGLGLWFGFPGVLPVLLLGSFVGVLWGMWKLHRLGRLRLWAKNFAAGVYLRLVCGLKGVLSVEKLPEDRDTPPPPAAVPFGTCLGIAAWVVWLAGFFLHSWG
ncbi:A24 family peptidase [Ammonifex thiophilus]|uniref:Prepilin peptidase n=1 Tax=Ammonifex thiophilus TaxID=444093 RepID=A0A3D8P385_9THEO|nr:A24 family peptidase [Ammonifex thiophilus]RDV80900.1 prepilin peptidase [Ammonifex thiophilus]